MNDALEKSDDVLEKSYAFCHIMTLLTGSNFHRSFNLISADKRRAMYALYAFLRRTDDLGDSDESADVRRQALTKWRDALEQALQGNFRDPLLPAVVDTIRRYGIPGELLMEAIEGVEMDLVPARYETFQDLEIYCRKVAGVVGVACLHIWGGDDSAAEQLAWTCGLAFQLTNIVRDLREDAEDDRFYLPAEDMSRFGVTEEEIRRGTMTPGLRELILFECRRGEELYRQGAALIAMLPRDSRGIFAAMFETYLRLLREIQKREGDVFSRRIRLHPLRAMWIVAKNYVRPTDVRRLFSSQRKRAL